MDNINDLFPIFITYLIKEKDSSKHTLANYQSDFIRFGEYLSLRKIEPYLKNMTTDVFRDYMKYLDGCGYKNASIRRKINFLKSFFNFLVLFDYVPKHPLMTIESPKREKLPPVGLRAEQVEKIIEAAKNNVGRDGLRDYILIKIIAQAGLTRQEVVDLNFSDIDFKNNLIHISKRKWKDREVPVRKELMDEIWNYMKSRMPLRSDAMFVTRTGQRIHATKCQTIFKNILKAAGLNTKDYSLKHLRHGYAVTLISKGVHVESVKELLGHQCMSSTSRYAHTSMMKLREAAEVLPY